MCVHTHTHTHTQTIKQAYVCTRPRHMRLRVRRLKDAPAERQRGLERLVEWLAVFVNLSGNCEQRRGTEWRLNRAVNRYEHTSRMEIQCLWMKSRAKSTQSIRHHTTDQPKVCPRCAESCPGFVRQARPGGGTVHLRVDASLDAYACHVSK